MTVFDLLFLGLAAASVVTLAAAAVLAMTGKGRQAGAGIRRWGICFAAYMGAVAATSAFLPRRVVGLGEAMCSDDWCLAVERVDYKAGACRAGFRIESRALRVTQREYGVSVYLTDAEGRRWDAKTPAGQAAFDVAIGPGDAIETTRVFAVPADARPTGMVIRHDSGFPIGWFIIGYETWFRKPTIVRLAE
jgi:hypothetical protein